VGGKAKKEISTEVRKMGSGGEGQGRERGWGGRGVGGRKEWEEEEGGMKNEFGVGKRGWGGTVRKGKGVEWVGGGG